MISKFLEITRKDERTILGLMSGTSADGLDVALVKLKGGGTDIDLKLITARTYEYDDEFKRKIIELYDPESSRVNDICEMNFLIAKKHAEFVLQFLKENNLNSEDVDCIAYHGQTIHHLPNGGKYGVRSTMQIGEMDLLAYMTGIMTVGDFRKKDLSAGG
ncbi:MAG TPA: anhydro-N-acetylmuramic acid kinase, partial [Thermotogales bacterium]|nr:anhydro-N-acetylmuramic acid kinase [Thermotogales bacterium]